MKRIFFILLIVFLLAPTWGYAGGYSDNDILLERMVEKGLLSPMDAQMIKEETQEYVSKHMAQGKMATLPEWIQRIRLTGDARLRYEHEKKKYQAGTLSNPYPAKSEQSEKARLRLGLIVQMNQKVVVAAGISTGSGDPRSANVTFGDSSARADVALDHIYAEYYPAPWMSVIGGKFQKEKYLWTPTDMLWDSDINPEGASMQFSKNLGQHYEVFASGGQWVIDNKSTKADPYLRYVQAGLGFEEESFDAKTAGTLYDFKHIKGVQLDYAACSNSGYDYDVVSGTCTSSPLTYGYKSKGLSGEIGYKRLFGENYKRIALFGDYIIDGGDGEKPKNLDAGFAYGVKFGDLKVIEIHEWQAVYQYTHLEKDAFPDIYPSSERWDGQTGVKGHKFSLHYGLYENLILGFSYYRTERLHQEDSLRQSLYEVDVTFKF